MTFSDWLKSELLRLKSLDWGHGSKSSHSQQDGTTKLTSHYSLSNVAKTIGISESDLAAALGSEEVAKELASKSFTLEQKDKHFAFSWIEDGIKDWKMDLNLDYTSETVQLSGGKIGWKTEYYLRTRWIDRVVYKDGTERIIKDTGEPQLVKISKEKFDEALEHIKRNNAAQEGQGMATN